MSAQRHHPGPTPSPELTQWLSRHITLGFDAPALVRSMCQSGYEEAYARATVDLALTEARRERRRPEPVSRGAAEAARNGARNEARVAGAGGHATGPLANAAAAADTADGDRGDDAAGRPEAADDDAGTGRPTGRNVLRHAGRDIPVLFSLASPPIVLYQQLLSADECEALIALSRGKLVRSPVVNPETGQENLIPARTSRGAMFQVGEYPLIEQIEARIAAVTAMPVEHGEGLQILNYQVGAEYRPHFDFFNPARPGEARQLDVGGQRVATLVIYLNDVPAGGGTAFPKLGLEVAPVRGNAVLFGYRGDDGSLDDRTLHAGLPVEAGEKWIATKWLREFPYRRDEGPGN